MDPLDFSTSVAFIDVLGTTEATHNALQSDGKIEKMLFKGNEIETIFLFVARLCQIDPDLYATTFSDSILMVRSSFLKLMPSVMALFQISCLTREFRIRAGIEIGNAWGPSSDSDLMKLINGNQIQNVMIPKYFYGDAVTGAVLAEKRLKGSRISLGDIVTSVINKRYSKLPPEIQELLIMRNENGRDFYEINWFNSKVTEATFNKLNRIDKFARAEEVLEMRFKSWLQNPKDDYCKIMIGLGYELGIIPIRP